MLLTISTTHSPATDLGYILAKNPAKVQSFPLAYGQAHVFYPVATDARCTAALALDVDPIGLVRGRTPGGAGAVGQYVNDRPYVASSFLSVAIAQVLGSALGGRCRDRPELVDTALPLEVRLEVVPCRGGEGFLRRLFEPLGYVVEATRIPLDDHFPEWGESAYFRVDLNATIRVKDLLSHLYVLVPVLDDEKHYWVGDDEVDKLLAKGGDWLPSHPEKTEIAHRYLKHRRSLARLALDRLVTDDAALPDDEESGDEGEAAVERRLSLDEARVEAVTSTLRELGASAVLDLGCGEGKLLRRLLTEARFTKVAGVDVSVRALEIARSRLRVDDLPARERDRLSLFHGALTYRNTAFAGFDAATLVEVVEHVEPSRLGALERVVFAFARPKAVVVTTPNVEYNTKFERLPAGRFRHPDHRFEWTRAEFTRWGERVAAEHGYAVRYAAIGPVDAELGAPTQMAVFTLASPSEVSARAATTKARAS